VILLGSPQPCSFLLVPPGQKHNNTELTGIHKYFTENVTHNQAYHFYNPYVIQDLFDNKSLEQNNYFNWVEGGIQPQKIQLPYSGIKLCWNAKKS
jgi:hypothetical protein